MGSLLELQYKMSLLCCSKLRQHLWHGVAIINDFSSACVLLKHGCSVDPDVIRLIGKSLDKQLLQFRDAIQMYFVVEEIQVLKALVSRGHASPPPLFAAIFSLPKDVAL